MENWKGHNRSKTCKNLYILIASHPSRSSPDTQRPKMSPRTSRQWTLTTLMDIINYRWAQSCDFSWAINRDMLIMTVQSPREVRRFMHSGFKWWNVLTSLVSVFGLCHSNIVSLNSEAMTVKYVFHSRQHTLRLIIMHVSTNVNPNEIISLASTAVQRLKQALCSCI